MESLVATQKESWLSWFLRGLAILGFLVLVARLIEVQIIKGKYFRSLAEENRIKKISITAPRGRILARGGEVLEGADFAHITGYLGEVGPEEVGKIDPKCIQKGPKGLGELTGRNGLQEMYDCTLKGVDGEELIEVDTAGKQVRLLGKKEPIAGGDLKTNIDYGLQKKAAEAMAGKPGAVVVSDPKGEILVLFSSPSFDSKQIAASINDPTLPLFNRAIGGMFHPGSVFKPIVAVAALEEGKIDSGFTFTDPGVITVNKFSYYNWYFSQYGKTEGTIGLTRAIARSTDTFFYKIGEMTGPDAISKWAGKFGLGEKTGIDIPGEIAGLLPTPEWKRRVKGEPWFLGNTYHFSIGQGDIALTPIQVNSAIAAVANNGELCRPRMIQGDSNCERLGIDAKNLELVKEGMVGACSQGGTGYTFFDFPSTHSGLRVACKTGTAETSLENYTHAWFTLFAPADFPEIVATVLVEKGGEGSKIAGPIARQILDFWAEKRI